MKMLPFFVGPYPTQRQIDDAIDDFAELLSRDLTLRQIAQVMCVTVGTCCVLLRFVCERMGEPVA